MYSVTMMEQNIMATTDQTFWVRKKKIFSRAPAPFPPNWHFWNRKKARQPKRGPTIT